MPNLSRKLIARDISTVRMSQGNKPRAVITTCTHFAMFLSFQMFKVPLRRKFCIPFSLQLLKVEVINTYHAKFYIEIPTGRPVILIVKFSFVLPPLLDSKNGREPGSSRTERNMTSYAHNNMARFRMADLAERSHISGSRAIFTTPTYCKHLKENSW